MARKRHHQSNINMFLVLLLIIFPIFFLAISANAFPTDKPQRPSPIIGIDLGDSHTRVACKKDGNLTIFSDARGHRSIPHYGTFDYKRGPLWGHKAKDYDGAWAPESLSGFRRLLGHTFKDVQNELEDYPFEIVDDHGLPRIRIEEHGLPDVWTDAQPPYSTVLVSPDYIATRFFYEAKRVAEENLGEEVREAVVAVPSSFNDKQRTAIKDAAQVAGLTILRVVNEPSAAGLAYELDLTNSIERTVLVYNVGSSKSDATVLLIEEGVYEIVGEASRSQFGDQTFDNLVMDHSVDIHGIDDSEYPNPKEWLEPMIGHVKRKLFIESVADVAQDLLRSTPKIPKLEEIVAQLDRPIHLATEALANANVTKSEIDEIVVTGDASRVPRVGSLLKNHFKKPVIHRNDIAPDEVIVSGAARQASVLAGEYTGGCYFTTLAASGLDVETVGGHIIPLMQRKTSLPFQQTLSFTTTKEAQTEIGFRIYANRGYESYQVCLATPRLDIPPAPRGVPRIDVTFEVDEMELMNVTILHKDSGKSSSTMINTYGAVICDEEVPEHAQIIALNQLSLEAPPDQNEL